MGKQSAKSAFKTQFKLWRKETGETPEQFAKFLVADIRSRLQAKQFGFKKLHPATYLNGKRWLDDKPVVQSHSDKPQTTTTSTFTVITDWYFSNHIIMKSIIKSILIRGYNYGWLSAGIVQYGFDKFNLREA